MHFTKYHSWATVLRLNNLREGGCHPSGHLPGQGGPPRGLRDTKVPHHALGDIIRACMVPFGDSRQDEEHPEVDAEDQDDLEDELAQHGLAEVERAVDDHGGELDEQHDQEGLWHLVIRQ